MTTMAPVEIAAFDHIYDQLADHKVTSQDYYAVDLVMDILQDDRLSGTRLSLGKYIHIIGPDAWEDLLGKHAHTSNVTNV